MRLGTGNDVMAGPDHTRPPRSGSFSVAADGAYEELWLGLLRAHCPTLSDEGLVLGLVLFRYSLVTGSAADVAALLQRLEPPLRSRPRALRNLLDLAPGWSASLAALVDAAVYQSF